MENDKSPELIEQEMQTTRNSLTDKVATLEQSVVGTLHSATSAVQDTVDTVKDTVESMKSAMTETVASVKGTVQESVESVADNVRHAFDVSDHVRNNPWMMVGGAAVAGFVTGLFAFRGRSEGHISSAMSDRIQDSGYRPKPSPATRAYEPVAAAPAAPAEPTWLDKLFERAGNELRKLGESALDQATQALQQSVHQAVPQLVKEVESRLGVALGGIVGEAQPANGRRM